MRDPRESFAWRPLLPVHTFATACQIAHFLSAHQNSTDPQRSYSGCDILTRRREGICAPFRERILAPQTLEFRARGCRARTSRAAEQSTFSISVHTRLL